MFYKIFFTIILFVCAVNKGFAQSEMPFYGSNIDEVENVIIDVASISFLAPIDTFRLITIQTNDNKYTLTDFHEHILVRGEVSRLALGSLNYEREGLWEEFYPNGLLKSIGYYHSGQPIDNWEFFFSNGLKKEAISYKKEELEGTFFNVISGPYEAYYNNGQLRVMGQYKTVWDTVSVENFNVNTGKTENQIELEPLSKRYGVWYFYHSNGELDKKEDFGL